MISKNIFPKYETATNGTATTLLVVDVKNGILLKGTGIATLLFTFLA